MRGAFLLCREYNANMKRIIIGIDEAGRGPLAGPVSVCALAILKKLPKELMGEIKDSKQLSEIKREFLYKKLVGAEKGGYISFAQSFSSAKIIDTKGIVYAIRSAMKRSLGRLKISPTRATVLLDGALKAPAEYTNQKTIIRGDATIRAIALASIVAKVRRDRLLKKFANKFPGYGFEIHKGYGTKAHYKAIKENGVSPIHRLTFLKSVAK